MNGTDQSLIAKAYSERDTLGYITTTTRASILDTGMTAAALEEALLNMERN